MPSISSEMSRSQMGIIPKTLVVCTATGYTLVIKLYNDLDPFQNESRSPRTSLEIARNLYSQCRRQRRNTRTMHSIIIMSYKGICVATYNLTDTILDRIANAFSAIYGNYVYH